MCSIIKSLLPEITSGFFLIISVCIGANIFVKKNQMKKYSRQLENQNNKLRLSKQLLEKSFCDFISNRGIAGNWYENYQRELEKYNSKIYEYNSLITEINLFCEANIQPKFFYAKFDDNVGKINYEK